MSIKLILEQGYLIIKKAFMSEIYAITDDVLTPEETIFKQCEELLRCGVKILQYRTKKELNELIAGNLLNLCHKFNAKFIINDNVNLAAKIKADGVHIGKDDMAITLARKLLGQNAIIGVSCYNDVNLAISAQNQGASYVAFGAMFASQTKPNALYCERETIKKAKQILRIPICVIGGINPSNIKEICALKPDYIAVISALYKPNCIKENYENLIKNLC